jgi:hypothetical protein
MLMFLLINTYVHVQICFPIDIFCYYTCLYIYNYIYITYNDVSNICIRCKVKTVRKKQRDNLM